jgi:creatinine amidohydrolase
MPSFETLHTENVRSAAANSLLILPMGAIEQHGPHLPLTVDVEIPVRIASVVAERLPAYVAPVVAYGARSLPPSGGEPTLAGTIPVRGAVLTEYLKDVIAGYVAAGFGSIFVLNGHYENESFVFEALELCRHEGLLEEKKAIAASWWSFVSDAVIEKLFGGQFPGWCAEHASACETSLMLHFRKDLVGSTRVDNAAPPRPGVYLYPVADGSMSNRGVLGKASIATAEIGKALCDEICSQITALARQHFRL